jgi:hypothetical protein
VSAGESSTEHAGCSCCTHLSPSCCSSLHTKRSGTVPGSKVGELIINEPFGPQLTHGLLAVEISNYEHVKLNKISSCRSLSAEEGKSADDASPKKKRKRGGKSGKSVAVKKPKRVGRH